MTRDVQLMTIRCLENVIARVKRGDMRGVLIAGVAEPGHDGVKLVCGEATDLEWHLAIADLAEVVSRPAFEPSVEVELFVGEEPDPKN